MPSHHSRKAAVRRRQAETGESFTEAANALSRDRQMLLRPICTLAGEVPGHGPWGECPEACPTTERDDYRAWFTQLPRRLRHHYVEPTTGPEPSTCPGWETCTDWDCPEGCHDTFVSVCSDCLYVLDQDEETCPSGCSLPRPSAPVTPGHTPAPAPTADR